MSPHELSLLEWTATDDQKPVFDADQEADSLIIHWPETGGFDVWTEVAHFGANHGEELHTDPGTYWAWLPANVSEPGKRLQKLEAAERILMDHLRSASEDDLAMWEACSEDGVPPQAIARNERIAAAQQAIFGPDQ